MFLGSVRCDDQNFVYFPVRKLIVGFFLNLLRKSVLFGCRNVHHFLIEMKIQLLSIISPFGLLFA